MEKGHFYFLNDDYFIKFQDAYLMQNKESINEIIHDRPCFYVIEDNTNQI